MNHSSKDIIQSAKATLDSEASALRSAAEKLGPSFSHATTAILNAEGKVVITGLGKSGHVGRKISATFASTGTPAFFLHPAEALHGDLGMIQPKDVLVAIAFGGETEEVLAVARHAKRLGVPIISITGKLDSSLGRMSNYVLDGSVEREVCPHNLAPTASTAVTMALGDALAMALMQARGFSEADFARLHPSGALGRRLATVNDLMKPIGVDFPTVEADTKFHQVLEAVTKKNYGIVPVLSQEGLLVGAISDGDIRRTLLAQGSRALGLPASEFMTKKPRTIHSGALAIDAFKRMEDSQITSLFVVTPSNSDLLVGIVRMHDLLAAKIV